MYEFFHVCVFLLKTIYPFVPELEIFVILKGKNKKNERLYKIGFIMECNRIFCIFLQNRTAFVYNYGVHTDDKK